MVSLALSKSNLPMLQIVKLLQTDPFDRIGSMTVAIGFKLVYPRRSDVSHYSSSQRRLFAASSIARGTSPGRAILALLAVFVGHSCGPRLGMRGRNMRVDRA
jgi:hypothetical protein